MCYINVRLFSGYRFGQVKRLQHSHLNIPFGIRILQVAERNLPSITIVWEFQEEGKQLDEPTPACL